MNPRPRIPHLTRRTVAHLAAGGLAGAVLATGGYALASSSSQIHSCVDKHTTVLHVQSRCGRGQNRLVWNQQGAPGKQGPRGATGSQGQQGQTGPQGPPAASAWAVVNADGSIAGGHGITIQHFGGGTYGARAGGVCSIGTPATVAVNPDAAPLGPPQPPLAWASGGASADFTVNTGRLVSGTFTPIDLPFDITITCS
jgi:hypothetical protein